MATALTSARYLEMGPLEAALLEDNKEVLAAQRRELKERARNSTSSEGGRNGRAPSPSLGPRSPTRALVDAEYDGSRRALMGFSTSYIPHSPHSSPRLSNVHMAPYRVLDTSTVVASKISKSAASSPIEANHRVSLSHSGRHRTASDASNHPASFGPRAGSSNIPESHNHLSGNPPSNFGGSVVPKRSTQGGWAKKLVPSAMAEVVRGGDLSVFGAGDRGRNHSVGSAGVRLSKSRSPGGWGLRSISPGGAKGKQLARRPSDPKARPGNSILSTSRSRAGSTSSVDNQGPNGPRLKKNHIMKDGKECLDDSTDESNSSDEDQRGRKQKPAVPYNPVVTMEEIKQESRKYRPPLNMFEAIDQERK